MTTDRRLLDLDAEKAVELKFQLGRERHGPEWVGKRPIREAHDEVLDALAYIREELKAGELPETVLMELYISLLNALQGVRVMVSMVEEMERGSQDGSEGDGGEGEGRADEALGGEEGV